MLCVYAMNCNY